jgi:hypothetical protein
VSYDAETTDALGELAGKVVEMGERIRKLEQELDLREEEIVSLH